MHVYDKGRGGHWSSKYCTSNKFFRRQLSVLSSIFRLNFHQSFILNRQNPFHWNIYKARYKKYISKATIFWFLFEYSWYLFTLSFPIQNMAKTIIVWCSQHYSDQELNVVLFSHYSFRGVTYWHIKTQIQQKATCKNLYLSLKSGKTDYCILVQLLEI